MFLFQDDPTKQLVLQALHVYSEINYGCPGTDFRGVCWIRQFGGYIELEAIHHIYLFVSHFNLQKKYPRISEKTYFTAVFFLFVRLLQPTTLKLVPDLMKFFSSTLSRAGSSSSYTSSMSNGCPRERQSSKCDRKNLWLSDVT